MAEYSSDEERFSAVVNFFKDYKVIILSSLILIFVSSSINNWLSIIQRKQKLRSCNNL